MKTCTDQDSECKDVKNKTVCYLYDPVKGACPYLNKDPKPQAIKDQRETVK